MSTHGGRYHTFIDRQPSDGSNTTLSNHRTVASMPLIHLLLRWPSKLRRRARRSRLTLMILLLLLFCSMVAPFYIIYKPPSFIIAYLRWKFPDVLWQVSTNKKMVALTIDDAPSEYTDAILGQLRASGASATFFAIGSQIDERESALRDIVREGHEIGNHAMYDEPSRSLSDAELAQQIRNVHAKIDAVYWQVGDADNDKNRPLYFRPGSGFFSRRMLSNVAKLDYRVVMGSVYPHDPQIPYSKVNAAHILSMVRPGAIIICHDRRSWTAPMLGKVLPELKKRGYEVVTVTKLLESAQSA